MNEIIIIKNVRCRLDSEGNPEFNLEDVARGLSFTTIAASGNEVIRWNTVYGYLSDLGVATSCNDELPYKDRCPEYIPEYIFYRLAMKAKNEAAEKFQDIIAREVVPAIRKHGMYATPKALEAMLEDPDTMIQTLQALKAEQEKRKALEADNSRLTVENQIMAPKAGFYDMILQNKGLLSTSEIAKDYGMSARAMNNLLYEKGIQYKQGDIWLPYQKYASKGYMQSKTFAPDADHSHVHMYWTQRGRIFIYETLKADGILPLIEKNQD